jgi:hypothetical protein
MRHVKELSRVEFNKHITDTLPEPYHLYFEGDCWRYRHPTVCHLTDG